MITSQIKSENLTVKCDCGCGILSITQDNWKDFDDNLNEYNSYDEQTIFIEYYVSSFYREQKGIFNTLWERIKFAWSILTGKKYEIYDIVINGEGANKFKKELQEFLDKTNIKEYSKMSK